MRLLLHTCCGPCLEYPARELTKENINFTPYFYNPNIQPDWEYKRRIEALRELSKLKNFNTIFVTPPKEELSVSVKKNEIHWKSFEKDDRCEYCYKSRLESTAKYASENGFDSFSTTLLLSIYQNHDLIISIGKKLAEEYNINFYVRDFRPGFRESQNMAKEDNLYRQKYCGCICSLNESALKEKIISSVP